MAPTTEVYKSHLLTPLPQPAGGYHGQTEPIAGGKPFLTALFQDLADAMAQARLLVYQGIRA
jgi:hypothetical protein